MREASFLRQNADRWREFERLLGVQGKGASPDQLADLFVQVADDLSYARTFFPDSRATAYLNSLALRSHHAIYRNRREKKGRIWTFWREEVPLALYRSRRELFYALLIFLLSATVGALSAAHDESFARMILGDGYVNMTLENIRNGDPMAVYKGDGELEMFFRIGLNNIIVALKTFAFGIIASFGTAWILFNNGVMLGSFQYFFYQQGLLSESALVVWIHGTIEISSIVVAGAAGFAMGNGILFPGTYSRKAAFQRGAKRGMTVVIGMIPFFVVAAFLESFVTRYTDMPLPLSLLIIGGSLALVIWYFALYPRSVYRSLLHGVDRSLNSATNGSSAIFSASSFDISDIISPP